MIEDARPYPGGPRHRAVIQVVASHYQNDPRVLAVGVFGSLRRGNWDELSDIDLDIIVADGVVIDPIDEWRGLEASLAAIGERVALLIPDGDEAVDVVLRSLMELSIRYHPLVTTSPNIIDSLVVIAGRIDIDAIQAAAAEQARHRQADEPSIHQLDACVRYALEVRRNIRRGRRWGAIEALHRMRGLLMEMHARARGAERPVHAFDANADAMIQARLGATLPAFNLPSIESALAECIRFLEDDLPELTNHQLQLSEAHREVLRGVTRDA